MAITSVSGTTFLADTVNLIRDKLKNNVTDPISDIRPANQRFAYTSYPQKAVTYPIITIVDRNITQPQRLGMGSEGTLIYMDIEIRIWARNVKERDELFDEVYTYLKNNQYDSTTGLIDSNLNGFQLTSAVNISEDGEQTPKSKVMEVRFTFVNN